MEVSKIRTLVTRAGEMQGLSIVDLIYIGNIPYAVFEWKKPEEGEENVDPMPLYKVRLDSRGIMELPANSSIPYQYRISVEDPRPFS